ncbi:DNA repair ATPase [Citricoccus zhacaiensis]|uniref:DNA repair ATPase n=1 Tax=Citricoccus zhacaiensis TaxID=489142 RepID=A0ABQ2LQY8_9MICC|nr:SbcC/MukB-like Walker B domain-containing protein [Citricoccus zhacaiensis]GGO42091.1 DNA repair ATPase [Citricoccus zhacaiensis]
MTAQQKLDFGLGATAASSAQWRLAEVQLANWGTLDGSIYRLPVARKGHLITGPSGSGKSSILDAIAAVLTPDQWLRFNQAAQGGSGKAPTRNLMSYLRGAWTRTQDESEDRVVSAYLRPRATWSGIILRYESGTGKTVSLCRLFFLRGTATTRADMRDLCLLEHSAVDLSELQPFVAQGIQTRKVQSAWPNAVVTTNTAHGPFYARLRSVFGIRDAAALQLLHRTQSAKGLDSLDQLFRHHMLERPATFAMAEKAVEEFGALRTAYERVVDLRRQRDHLEGLRAAATEYEAAQSQADRLRDLQDAVHPYQRIRQLELIQDELHGLRESLHGLRAAHEQAEAVHAQARQAHTDAQLTLHQVGGTRVTDLQRQREELRARRTEVSDRWDTLRSRLERAGIGTVPTTAGEFAELLTEIEKDLEAPAADLGPTHEQNRAAFETQDRLRRIDADIAALRRGSSAVPAPLLGVRERLAEQLGVPTSALPFAAELLEVEAGQEQWAGAIERVLSPLSLTLLVPARLLRQARSWIDGHHLGLRLRYEEVTGTTEAVRPARSEASLVHKIAVRPGEFHDWLQSRLSSRFDYACVKTAAELDDHLRAVTLAGQVKSSATSYEKNDRHRLDDRSRWVLGDPAAKLEALLESRHLVEAEHAEASAAVEQAQRAANHERDRRTALQSVRETPWKDVDHWTVSRAAEAVEDQLRQLTEGDIGLQAATDRERAAASEEGDAQTAAQQARLELDRAETDEARLGAERDELLALGAGTETVPEPLAVELAARFRTVRRKLTRVSLPETTQTVLRDIGRELDATRSASNGAATRCTMLTTEFSQLWPSVAADATPGVEDRGSYLQILDRIIGQGLPEHESRFQQLLHERSSTLIGELSSEIRSAPGEIENRVEPINTSLARSPFDEGRFLRLRVKTRRSETVRGFMADLAAVAEHSWSEEDLTAAENRYRRLAAIMDRFASSEHADRTWRQACLDTREHVTFLADEVDVHGTAHATYDSGAAMSGGQQQKLVIFCLAAALRYQLASPDDPLPAYGTVILDEAFDKADVRYTRMAMDVFVEFGFQMVLATPQKLLQTIEPYVGGITTVENPSRRLTRLADVTWESGGTAGRGDAESSA